MAFPHQLNFSLPNPLPPNLNLGADQTHCAIQYRYARKNLSNSLNATSGIIGFTYQFFADNFIPANTRTYIAGWSCTDDYAFNTIDNCMTVDLTCAVDGSYNELPVYISDLAYNPVSQYIQFDIQGANSGDWATSVFSQSVTNELGLSVLPVSELWSTQGGGLLRTYTALYDPQDFEIYAPAPADQSAVQNMIQGGLYRLPCFTPCVPHAIKKGD